MSEMVECYPTALRAHAEIAALAVKKPVISQVPCKEKAMATAAAALIVRARREIQHHFFAEDAVRSDRAVAFIPANAIEARQFDTMLTHGSIKREGADRYWLDVVAYDLGVQRRHRRARLVLISVIIALAALALMLGYNDGHQFKS
jgi:hypothetical protein